MKVTTLILQTDDNTDANLVTFTTKTVGMYAREPAQINSIGLGNRSGGLLNRTLENYQNIYYSFETVLFIHIFFQVNAK